MNEPTVQDLAKQIEELKRKVEELERWKREREQTQITYPLDPRSQKVLKQALNL